MIKELIRISSQNKKQKVIVFENDIHQKYFGKSKVLYQRETIRKFLINEFEDQSLLIQHNENGAPFIKGYDNFISISHSDNLFAIQISNENIVGIDIQIYKEGIEKGINYFVNENDRKNIDFNRDSLHLIWAVKEAVYKLLKGKVNRYKEDLTILSISECDIVKVKYENRIVKCKFILHDKFILVYVI